LKNHKGVAIILIVKFFLEYASFLAKFQCSRLDANQKSFCALMIEITKEIEIGEKKITTHFNTFNLNNPLALKFMNFEDVISTKVIHFYVIKSMNA